MCYFLTYIPNVLKSFNIGLGKYLSSDSLYAGTFLQSNAGSGQRAHGGQGGHFTFTSRLYVLPS